MLTRQDLDRAVLVSVDIQQMERAHFTEDNLMPLERRLGFTAGDYVIASTAEVLALESV